MGRVCAANPADVTAIGVEDIDPTKWFIADKSLAEHGLAAFWIDLRITEAPTRAKKG